MSACACMGPPGNCPCIRASRGLPQQITETYIAPEVFDCLTDDEKETINRLKQQAFATWFSMRNSKQ